MVAIFLICSQIEVVEFSLCQDATEGMSYAKKEQSFKKSSTSAMFFKALISSAVFGSLFSF